MALVAQVVVGVRPETGKTKGPLLVLARKISSPVMMMKRLVIKVLIMMLLIRMRGPGCLSWLYYTGFNGC